MDYQDQILVESTVMTFVNNKSSFTAYDVTKTIRVQSQNNIYHSEVNTEVQKLYAQDDMGLYERDIVNVGAPVEPFVYHDPSVDAFSYDKDWLTDGAPSTSVAVLDVDDDENEDFGADDLDVASVDDDDTVVGVTSASSSSTTGKVLQTIITEPARDGRVTISAKLISQLLHKDNLRGDVLGVHNIDRVNHSLDISINPSIGTSKSIDYSVDEDNRIRLSKRTLAKAGLSIDDNVHALQISLVQSDQTSVKRIFVTSGMNLTIG